MGIEDGWDFLSLGVIESQLMQLANDTKDPKESGVVHRVWVLE